MSEEAFREAISATPEDDAPRLVFADWLMEHGDAARGELIRVQCELARLSLDAPERPALEDRERDLVAANVRRWLEPIKQHVYDWSFDRGLLEVVTDAETFIGYGEELVRAGVCGVRLNGAVRALPRLLSCQALARVLSLDLQHYGLAAAAAEYLAAAAALSFLNNLSLESNHIGDEGVRRLAGSPHLTRLSRLNLSQNDLGAPGLA